MPRVVISIKETAVTPADSRRRCLGRGVSAVRAGLPSALRHHSLARALGGRC